MGITVKCKQAAKSKYRHVVNSSPLVDSKYQNIWGVIEQLILRSYIILWLNIDYYSKQAIIVGVRHIKGIFIGLALSILSLENVQIIQV